MVLILYDTIIYLFLIDPYSMIIVDWSRWLITGMIMINAGYDWMLGITTRTSHPLACGRLSHIYLSENQTNHVWHVTSTNRAAVDGTMSGTMSTLWNMQLTQIIWFDQILNYYFTEVRFR